MTLLDARARTGRMSPINPVAKLGASALIGIFIGGPLGGWLADKLGRKPLFTIDLAIFTVGSVLVRWGI